jgi:hypothetical protein
LNGLFMAVGYLIGGGALIALIIAAATKARRSTGHVRQHIFCNQVNGASALAQIAHRPMPSAAAISRLNSVFQLQLFSDR